MNNSSVSIYEEYLTELNGFEKEIQDDFLKDFEAWKQKIQNLLEGSYRIRFSKLEFYEKELNNTNNDIPF